MLKPELIAAVCHEANRAYCLALGDVSQPEWIVAPAWQRESAIQGVLFHLDHPGALPSASHESWLAVKREDGWRYGATKDAIEKTHPCFVPFEALPLDQQKKDVLFSAIVNAFR